MAASCHGAIRWQRWWISAWPPDMSPPGCFSVKKWLKVFSLQHCYFLVGCWSDSIIYCHKWGFWRAISMARSSTFSKRLSKLRSSQKEVPHCAIHWQTSYPTVYSRPRPSEIRSDFGGFWENRKWIAYVIYIAEGWCYCRTCAGPCLQSLWIPSWKTCTNDLEVWDHTWCTL